MKAILLTVIYSVNLMAAEPQMNVAICNLGGLTEYVVSQAKSETDLVYRSAGVQIAWHDCEEFSDLASKPGAPWFVIRLRNDKPPKTVGPASLDVMGKAYVENRGGYMADAYFQAIEDSAQLYNGDPGVLLGFVIAHELGHLILGPGHAPDGVMQAAWGQKQIYALRQRWLTLSDKCGKRIRLALDARTKLAK